MTRWLIAALLLLCLCRPLVTYQYNDTSPDYDVTSSITFTQSLRSIVDVTDRKWTQSAAENVSLTSDGHRDQLNSGAANVPTDGGLSAATTSDVTKETGNATDGVTALTDEYTQSLRSDDYLNYTVNYSDKRVNYSEAKQEQSANDTYTTELQQSDSIIVSTISDSVLESNSTGSASYDAIEEVNEGVTPRPSVRPEMMSSSDRQVLPSVSDDQTRSVIDEAHNSHSTGPRRYLEQLIEHHRHYLMKGQAPAVDFNRLLWQEQPMVVLFSALTGMIAALLLVVVVYWCKTCNLRRSSFIKTGRCWRRNSNDQQALLTGP